MKRSWLIFCSALIFCVSFNIHSAEQSVQENVMRKKAQEIFSQLVYIDALTRKHIVAMQDLAPTYEWSKTYKSICLDILDSATVMLHNDVAQVLAECVNACMCLDEEKRTQQLAIFERYNNMFLAGKAHICTWELDAENQLQTRNFDDSRIILQLGVRSLTVEGTEIVNGLLLVNGILKINGRIILNGVDVGTLLSEISTSTSSGITTINGDTSFVTGSTVAFKGLTNGGTVSFAGNGAQQMVLSMADGSNNVLLGTGTPSPSSSVDCVGVGVGALSSISAATAVANVAVGNNAMRSLTNGGSNVAIGSLAGLNMNNASGNVLIGAAVSTILTGTNNTLVGLQAGSNYTDSTNNICLGAGVSGTTGENTTMRLGAIGTITQTFIAGIANATVSGAMVLTNTATSQLGIATSSKRFKENITPMPETFTDDVLKLKPVLFNYKVDTAKTQNWGLIAEEVQEVLPQLVICDAQGLPFTIKYHDLPVLLLNELIKLKKEVEELKLRQQ